MARDGDDEHGGRLGNLCDQRGTKSYKMRLRVLCTLMRRGDILSWKSDLANNRATSQLRAREGGGGSSLVRLGLDLHDCLDGEDSGRDTWNHIAKVYRLYLASRHLGLIETSPYV